MSTNETKKEYSNRDGCSGTNSNRKRSISTSSSGSECRKRKNEKKSRKHKKDKHKMKALKRKAKQKQLSTNVSDPMKYSASEYKISVVEEGTKSGNNNFDVLMNLMESKSLAPMTKDEWDKKQSVVKRVYDEISGRHRLVKGDGEIIEEIVSKRRHMVINEQATKGDGDYFVSVMNLNR